MPSTFFDDDAAPETIVALSPRELAGFVWFKVPAAPQGAQSEIKEIRGVVQAEMVSRASAAAAD